MLEPTPVDEDTPHLPFDLVSVGCETRDHETKREEYLVYGLQDYWIVDPEAQKATVLSRRDDP